MIQWIVNSLFVYSNIATKHLIWKNIYDSLLTHEHDKLLKCTIIVASCMKFYINNWYGLRGKYEHADKSL